tara:strand:+ start:267 stop:1208 length:942 start_codon:yes stop_codon:yes gene_type:complete
MKNIVCIISGPTASGKTSTSIGLAKKFGGEIVNFDSLLFYKEIKIGTAKPTLEEMDGVPHHMVNTHSIKEPINAADYLKEALPIINSIHQRGEIVYLVGGSGFYLQALLYGMYDSITTPAEILKKSEDLFESSGILPFLDVLKENDPESFERYHQNDHYRIRRAVEHFWATKTKLSAARQDMDEKKKPGPMEEFNWNVFHIHLDLPKPEHFEIIQKRANEMVKLGLVYEVKHLLSSGYDGEEKPLKSIGYKETLDYIKGNFDSEDAYLERIAISTRQLAKSQRTWFKKVEKNTYNPIIDIEKIYNDYKEFLTK